MEKKNIFTGIILIALFLVMGAYLESQLGGDILWKTSSKHAFWKSAHIHGLAFGILNILYGFLLKNYVTQKNIANIGSYLAIIGSLLPVGLFLAGIQPDLKFIIPAGGISMITAWFIMGYAVMVKK